MTPKAAIRRMLLLPIQPRAFAFGLLILRRLRLLPPHVAPEWPPKRILVVTLTRHLGDAMMTMPFLDALSRALPESEIDLVIESALDGPLQQVSYLHHVYRFSPVLLSVPILDKYFRLWSMLQFARREWMHQAYDLAFLPRWGVDASMSQYLAAMSAAPVRCGHDSRQERTAEQIFSGAEALLTIVSHGGEGIAEGVRQQLLLTACGLTGQFEAAALERNISQGVAEIGQSVDLQSCMARLQIAPDRPYMLFAPGASHAARKWPPERFASVACALSQSTNHAIYSIGGPEDRELGERIHVLSHGTVLNLAGLTSVPETIALTQRATLLLTNDSGPAHIGGSLGTSTLVLSACPKTSRFEHANSPSRVRPIGPHVMVLQPEDSASGCADRCLQEDAHCILGLTAQDVLTECLRIIAWRN